MDARAARVPALRGVHLIRRRDVAVAALLERVTGGQKVDAGWWCCWWRRRRWRRRGAGGRRNARRRRRKGRRRYQQGFGTRQSWAAVGAVGAVLARVVGAVRAAVAAHAVQDDGGVLGNVAVGVAVRVACERCKVAVPRIVARVGADVARLERRRRRRRAGQVKGVVWAVAAVLRAVESIRHVIVDAIENVKMRRCA